QMQVTVTRPIEDALNSVQGLERVQSITSRGSAEIDLFFSWNVDMFQTLERVNAALARVQAVLPSTARLTANRLTFAAFPILVSGQARSADDISNIVVKTTPLNVPVRIGDIATVSTSVKPVYVAVTANAKPAILLNVFRQPDSNTVAVADAVHGEIENIRRELPKAVELQPFYDQSNIVNDSI